jgi:heat shock protein HslJ
MRAIFVIGVVACALAFLCAASLPTAASAGSETKDNRSYIFPFAEIKDSFWRLATSKAKPSADDPVFKIDAGTIEIASRCNSIGLAFIASDGHFRYSNDYMSATSKNATCMSPVSAIADELRHAKSFQLKGETLSVYGDNMSEQVVLAHLHPYGLEYRSLKIEDYSDDGQLVVTRSLGNAQPEILFFGGMIEGAPGCGGFIGSYTLTGSHGMHIVLSAILAGMCENIDAAGQQDDEIIRNFGGDSFFKQIGPGRFALRDLRGKTRAILVER